MIVIAAVFCLMMVLLAAGLLLLELAVRLLPYVLGAVGWALEITLWLAAAGISASRALRGRPSALGPLPAAE